MTKTTDSAAPPSHPANFSANADLTENQNSDNNVGETSDLAIPVSGQLLGYVRVSRADQNLDRQQDALTEAGCSRIFADDGVSGSLSSRPALDEMLVFARPGDTIMISALDRLGRSTKNLLTLVDDLRERKISLKILNLGIDTGTSAGQLVLTVIAALAEMEKAQLVERTLDGLAAARNRGRVGGRPASLSPAQKLEVTRMREAGRTTGEIAAILGCSTRTIRRVPRR
ncbi:DNA invertase Pin-like site-specific DNA recombinase [Rhodoglobus vestalii]|uniref:DNA invertase Pin-like site-specific DNA recombinase n=1 Tax=Rhodoglobus vestalii TaxID=193384 RepID=A0A8H2PVP4_9MICO|nr:recombinase family protein [Rhodoglobus vestalii]TQO21082.1 DNA invertase Pin-like site-specific DNA recombinase [Rhodoglobus vestalii]